NNATQNATNSANSAAINLAHTNQTNTQTQSGSSSSCLIGCGGGGQAQLSAQSATTWQAALSKAEAGQNAINGNSPVTTAGGNVAGGANNATQNATNSANSAAINLAHTTQEGGQTQS
ncbi:MAG TPA: hypothetical protein VKX16_08300, partial [Chloroflexota bacterium]|nr:hypothetical protein [Chloroflexota bacterium]